MGKRTRRGSSIFSCSSPRSTFPDPHSNFTWYEEDIWTEIAKYMDGKSLVMLGAANRWFHRIAMQESVWKFACLRDLLVSEPEHVDFKWIKLYTSAFDGSHSYSFHQREKHIDWLRIGAFFFDSPVALLTEKLSSPVEIPQGGSTMQMVQNTGSCVLGGIKAGIWIADLQLVRCPACNLNTCEGTMQTLDARHIELFLNEEYNNGSWQYEEIGCHELNKHSDGARGGIFDMKHLKDSSTSEVGSGRIPFWLSNLKRDTIQCLMHHTNYHQEVLDLKSWEGKPNDWQPKTRITLHAVAVNTNLQQNEGIQVKYHAMKAGPDGEIVSIRITQQLI